MSRRRASHPKVRPHTFIPDPNVVDAHGRPKSCAICTLGPTNICHPTPPPAPPADTAALTARILGESRQE